MPPPEADDRVRMLIVHPALWPDLVEWLRARRLSVGMLPRELDADGERVYITVPMDVGC
jgi:hypothetical protein